MDLRRTPTGTSETDAEATQLTSEDETTRESEDTAGTEQIERREKSIWPFLVTMAPTLKILATAATLVTFLVVFLQAHSERERLLHEKVIWQEERGYLSRRVDELTSELAYLRNDYDDILQRKGEHIPLDAGWTPTGPGALGGGYTDDVNGVSLSARLSPESKYAELFLDLQWVKLWKFVRNDDGTYDFGGALLIATVKADTATQGDPRSTNGIQILLKNNEWECLAGGWKPISPSITSEKGMEVICEIPENHEIASAVRGISVHFGMGSESQETTQATYALTEVRLVK